VREVVGRRLTRLPDKTDAVLAVAAVLGERFEFPVLVQAVGEGELSVLEALDPAIAARLVEEDAVGRYHFAHALVRSTLEEALGPTRRAQLHLRAASAIEAVFADRLKGRAAILAGHYVQAGALAPPGRAVDALIAAGREAAAVLAWEQVAGHWQQALDLIDQGHGGEERRADLLARLADLLYVTGFDLARSITHIEKAIALFAEAGDHQRVAVLRSRLGGYLTSNPIYGIMDVPRGLREFEAAERVLEQQPDSLAYGYLQGTLAAATGIWAVRPEEGLIQSRRALDLAQRHGHDALAVIGGMLHAWALVAVGAVAEGLALVEQASASADRIDHRILCMRSVHIHGVSCLRLYEPLVVVAMSERELAQPRLAHAPIQRQLLQGQLAWAYALTGRLADAERVFGQTGGLPPGGAVGPPLELWRGDWEVAEALLIEWRHRYREMGDRYDEAVVGHWAAEVRRLRGDEAAAEEILGEMLDIAAPSGARVLEANFHIDLAILGGGRSRLDSARRHLDRARDLLSDSEDWRGLGGRLAMAEAAGVAAEGDFAGADSRFEAAIAVFRRHSLPWEEAEALLAWGRAGAADGKADEAAPRYDRALDLYQRIDASAPWRERVQRARSAL
jgi:tetratricopeptide (TPR) repeat protein